MLRLCLFFIVTVILSSCLFIDKPKIVVENQVKQEPRNIGFKGDSITVNTTIGDYKVFYKVSDLQTEFTVESNKNQQTKNIQERRQRDKIILLNIQRTDTTSVIPYKVIDIKEFEPLIGYLQIDKYFIESFCLKEVREKAVVFHINLCMFEKKITQEVNLIVSDNGSIEYKLAV